MLAKNTIRKIHQKEIVQSNGPAANSEASPITRIGAVNDMYSSELSLRKNESMGVYVNIISGSQKGASTLIQSERTYVIGSGLDSDIVLLDSSVQEHHLEISQQKNKLTISNCKGSLSVDDKSIELVSEFVCPMESKITIGTIEVYIGRAYKQQTSSNGVEGEIVSFGRTHDEQNKTVKKARPAHYKFLYFGTGILALMVGVLTLFGDAKTQVIRGDVNMSVQLERQLSAFKIKNMTLDSKGPNIVEVSGISFDEDEHNKILELTNGYGVRVLNKIVSSVGIKNSVDSLLESLNLNQGVQANFNNQGELEFEGTVSTQEDWTMFKAVMSQDIIHISEFNDENVNTIDELIERIRTEIGSYASPSTLSIIRVGHEIMVRGELDPIHLPSLEANVEKVRAKLGGYPNIITQIAEAKDPLKGVSINLVSTTGKPYIMIDDGKKYHEGDRLENGYLIREIKLKYVTFEKLGKFLEVTM